jgi:signal peptidase II
MRRSLRILVLVLLSTVAWDQVSKHVARRLLAGGVEYQAFGGVLTLTLADNEGAFLGLGSGLPGQLRLLLASVVVAALLVLVGVVLREHSSSGPTVFMVALLLAGGGSNLIDRICRQGRVTDFLLLRLGPLHTGVFNLADIAIMAGALGFLVVTVRTRTTDQQAE